MFQDPAKKINILIIAAVAIALIMAGLLTYILSRPNPTSVSPQALNPVDVSVSGRVTGFVPGGVKILVPTTKTGTDGAYIDNIERRIKLDGNSSFVKIDSKTNNKFLASVSDISFDDQLVVYGSALNAQNGDVTAKKIEIIK